MNRKDSEWFPINVGVRQGYVVPPDLFRIIENLMTWVVEQVVGVSFSDFYLAAFECADDTVLFSFSLQYHSSALNINAEPKTQSSSASYHRLHIGNDWLYLLRSYPTAS